MVLCSLRTCCSRICQNLDESAVRQTLASSATTRMGVRQSTQLWQQQFGSVPNQPLGVSPRFLPKPDANAFQLICGPRSASGERATSKLRRDWQMTRSSVIMALPHCPPQGESP